MITLFTLLILLAGPATPWAEEQQIFHIDKKAVPFVIDRNSNTWISKNCLTPNCGARLLLIKNSKFTDQNTAQMGGLNPSSIACSKTGGKVVIGRTSSGSESCFCRASDGTYVNCGAL